MVRLCVIFDAVTVKCDVQGVTVNESYCGEAEQNGPLVGSVAVESSPILTFSDTQLTSVAAAAVNGHAVIYLGTRHGHLKKVCYLAGSGQVGSGHGSVCQTRCLTRF